MTISTSLKLNPLQTMVSRIIKTLLPVLWKDKMLIADLQYSPFYTIDRLRRPIAAI
jgi:hypothetical protein